MGEAMEFASCSDCLVAAMISFWALGLVFGAFAMWCILRPARLALDEKVARPTKDDESE